MMKLYQIYRAFRRVFLYGSRRQKAYVALMLYAIAAMLTAVTIVMLGLGYDLLVTVLASSSSAIVFSLLSRFEQEGQK